MIPKFIQALEDFLQESLAPHLRPPQLFYEELHIHTIQRYQGLLSLRLPIFFLASSLDHSRDGKLRTLFRTFANPSLKMRYERRSGKIRSIRPRGIWC